MTFRLHLFEAILIIDLRKRLHSIGISIEITSCKAVKTLRRKRFVEEFRIETLIRSVNMKD